MAIFRKQATKKSAEMGVAGVKKNRGKKYRGNPQSLRKRRKTHRDSRPLFAF